METDIYHDCGHRRRNTDKRRKQLPQASKTELLHPDSMSTNVDNSPMTTINDIKNEVINLSPPQEWLYKCDCPKCISGAHFDKDIAESYRKRGELNNEVARLKKENETLERQVAFLQSEYSNAICKWLKAQKIVDDAQLAPAPEEPIK